MHRYILCNEFWNHLEPDQDFQAPPVVETIPQDLPATVGVAPTDAAAADGEAEDVGAELSDHEDEFGEPLPEADLAGSEKFDGPKKCYASAECHADDIE